MTLNNSAPQTEVKLLKDENWKLIQQNTFTRWVNQQLKQSNNSPQLENLATDFADGIFLIKLAEVLSGKGLPRFNKKPIMRTQKLDNVSLVLNFFQNEESIKIVNIDSSHIVDHNLKLILGLVWTLILHYSLSHQHFISTDTASAATVTNGGSNDLNNKKETPKQRLLSWIQAKVPGRRVGNFTSNWNDGITLGALVNAFTNGSLEEWQHWDSDNAFDNTQKAMQAAEQLLGVEKLLTPEELINPAVDEKSVMTYLAQFPKAQPIKQQIQQEQKEKQSIIIDKSDASLGNSQINVGPKNISSIRAVGPGLEGGVAEEKAVFYVDTHGRANYLEFSIEGPSKTEIICSDNGDGTAMVEYTPHVPGRYTINITELDTNTHIKDSPFVLWIEQATLLPYKNIPRPIHIPLLENCEGQVDQPFEFKIPNNIEAETFYAEVFDPNLRKIELDTHSNDMNSSEKFYSFTPQKEGKHLISIVADKLAVHGWPFVIFIDGPFDPNKIWCSGPGLSPTIQTQQKTNFSIDVHNIPKPKHVQVNIIGPDGIELPVEMDLRTCSIYNARYEPLIAGVHKIYLLINDQQIFNIPVTAIDYDKDELLVEESLEEDEHLLYYSPEMNDEYRRKNYQQQKLLTSNVGARVAIEIPEPVIGLNTSIVFTAPGQHLSDLNVNIQGPNNGDLKHDIKLEQLEKEKFRISFIPRQSGLYTVELNNNNGEIYGSPFKIPVALLGKQRAFMAWAGGPGLSIGVVGRPNPFTVWNANNLGGGELTVSIDGPGKAEVGTVQHPNESNYQVEYTVHSPGLYTISVLFNDAPIGGSPFKVFVKPQTIETLSKKYNNSPPLSPESERQHNYDYLQMTNITESSPKSNSNSEFYDDEHFSSRKNELTTSSTPQQREEEDYNNNSISNLSSPLQQTEGEEGGGCGDHHLVRATGAGLSNFTPKKQNEFVVDTSAAGLNALFVGAVTQHGPTDELSVIHNGGGKFVVKYTIPHDSDALIFVKYGDGQIPGSPFSVRPLQYDD